MSRGQKRAFANQQHNNNNYGGEGYYEEFSGVRDTSSVRPYYYNNRGGRGGARKQFCYVNAEFLQANSIDLQTGMSGNGNGFRGGRRVGWGMGNKWSSNQAHLRKDNSQHPNQRLGMGEPLTDDQGEDEKDHPTSNEISVTVPGRSDEATAVDLDDRVNRPRTREDRTSTRRRRHRSSSRARKHKKSRSRYSKKPRRREDVETSAEMTDISSSEEDDEDLRYALVRHKVSRKRLRREPGEIGDTDETPNTPSVDGSSPREREREEIESSPRNLVSDEVSVSKRGNSSKDSSTDYSRPQSAESNVSLTLQLKKMEALKLALSREQEIYNSKAHGSGSINNQVLSDASTVLVSASGRDDGHKGDSSHDEEDNLSPVSPANSQDSVSAKLVIDESVRNTPTSQPEDVSDEAVVNPLASVSTTEQQETGTTDVVDISRKVLDFPMTPPPTINKATTATTQRPSTSESTKSDTPSCRPGNGSSGTDQLERTPVSVSGKREVVNWKAQFEKLKKEGLAQAEKNKDKDKCISDLRRELKAAHDDKDSKIKAMRGKKTQIENELESSRKALAKLDKSLKESEQKLKKVEAELKTKDGELEAIKRNNADGNGNDNKCESQLVFALAYQDRLFIEVEKLRSVYETEILKLQEYYETRLNFFKSQNLAGPFLAMPNNFPKGCVMTPMNQMNVNQGMAPGHTDQQGNSRQEPRPHMGMFGSHLSPPEGIVPLNLNMQQSSLNSRTRLPIFMNPIPRRLAQMGLDTQTQCTNVTNTVVSANSSQSQTQLSASQQLQQQQSQQSISNTQNQSGSNTTSNFR